MTEQVSMGIHLASMLGINLSLEDAQKLVDFIEIRSFDALKQGFISGEQAALSRLTINPGRPPFNMS